MMAVISFDELIVEEWMMYSIINVCLNHKICKQWKAANNTKAETGVFSLLASAPRTRSRLRPGPVQNLASSHEAAVPSLT